MSQADFRPKKRSGVVPSGKPRRKIPLLRILLLIAIAFFGYLKFDSIWSGMRALSPVAAWDRAFGSNKPVEDNLPHPAWSPDSSEFSLECPRGLHACCETAPASASGICRQAGAVLNKAQARQVLGSLPPESPLRLHARAAVTRTGHGVFNLIALQGRAQGRAQGLAQGKASGGNFAFRKNSAGVWCDARQVCLSGPAPKSPLAVGRLLRGTADFPARWVSASAAVHPVLAGWVTAVDSVPGGARVRVYHGDELYTTYEPLRLSTSASGALKPGMSVSPGTFLGDAPWLSAGYTVFLSVRRGGLNLDPADFFAVQPIAVAEQSDSTMDVVDTP